MTAASCRSDLVVTDRRRSVDRVRLVAVNGERPIVEEVLRFEDLPPGALAGRRAVVRWRAGVHTRPHPQLAPSRPSVRPQRALTGDRRPDRLTRIRERDEERIALPANKRK